MVKERSRLPLTCWLTLGMLLAIPLVKFLPVGWIPRCTFRRLTDLPCPTCGSTRLFQSLSRWDLPAAFWLNPLMTVTLGVLIVYSLGAFFHWFQGGDGRWIRIPFQGKGWWWVGIFVALNWGYLILTDKP